MVNVGSARSRNKDSLRSFNYIFFLEMYLYEWLNTLDTQEDRKKIIKALIKCRHLMRYDTSDALQGITKKEGIESIFEDLDLFETTPRPVRDNNDLLSIRKDLSEVGYCRLRGLNTDAGKEDREKIYSQMVCDFASVMDVDPQSTIIDPNKLIDVNERAGIVPYKYNMFHSKSMWMVRGNPALVETMASIYDCPPEHLCVSYDTVGIRYAPEFIEHCIATMDEHSYADEYVYLQQLGTDELYPHVDQRFDYEFQENYQGIYAFTSTPTEKDGGIILFPSTHLLHGQVLQRIFEVSRYQEFIPYPQEFHEIFADSKPVHIPMEEGEYLIWDSRLVHSNCSIDPQRSDMHRIRHTDNPTLYDWWRMHRIVGYICYHPDNEYTKDSCTISDLKLNAENIYRRGWGTNHACNRPRVVEIESEVPSEWQSVYHRSLVTCIQPTSRQTS